MEEVPIHGASRAGKGGPGSITEATNRPLGRGEFPQWRALLPFM